jgi:cell wall-associated NlpC family hydrolase
MIGRPYKYRGDTPEGFDCSGLVRYSYLAAGMDLPHGTGPLSNSHVGIYAGDSKFVHAPSSGKKVRMDSLQDGYWKKHFLEARRL